VPRDGLRFSLETAQRDRIVNPSQDIRQISNITLRDEDVASVWSEVSGTASAARQPSVTGGAVVKLGRSRSGPVLIDAQKHVPPAWPQFTATIKNLFSSAFISGFNILSVDKYTVLDRESRAVHKNAHQ
jgi:hypothetical protein